MRRSRDTECVFSAAPCTCHSFYSFAFLYALYSRVSQQMIIKDIEQVRVFYSRKKQLFSNYQQLMLLCYCPNDPPGSVRVRPVHLDVTENIPQIKGQMRTDFVFYFLLLVSLSSNKHKINCTFHLKLSSFKPQTDNVAVNNSTEMPSCGWTLNIHLMSLYLLTNSLVI